MVATLKVDTIKEVNSSVDNLALDSSGNVTIGNNLTVTGTTTQTGNVSFTGSAAVGGNVTVGGATFSPSTPASGSVAITGTLAMGSSFLRNRIINGDMRIDQRATAVSGTAFSYTVDRWVVDKFNDATESFAQNSDAPSGFSYSLRDTISVGDATIGSTQYTQIQQIIEGFNIADLAFGTASAKSVTVSFWVRSTVTGQYTANIRNSDNSRICPFNYTILASNTWEYKTITLPGCTDGTWNTTNGAGIRISFYPALGSSYLGGTSGTWNTAVQFGSGSPVNGIASNGNIFAITGVQLEVGSVATPFERRQYGQELALCQRYYVRYVPGTNGNSSLAVGRQQGTTSSRVSLFYSPMRANPTATNSGGIIAFAGGGTAITAITTQYLSVQNGFLDASHAAVGATGNCVSIEISGANFFELAAEL